MRFFLFFLLTLITCQIKCCFLKNIPLQVKSTATNSICQVTRSLLQKRVCWFLPLSSALFRKKKKSIIIYMSCHWQKKKKSVYPCNRINQKKSIITYLCFMIILFELLLYFFFFFFLHFSCFSFWQCSSW